MVRNLHTYTTVVKRCPATVTVNVTVELLNRLAEVRLADDRIAPVDRLRPVPPDLHGLRTRHPPPAPDSAQPSDGSRAGDAQRAPRPCRRRPRPCESRADVPRPAACR